MPPLLFFIWIVGLVLLAFVYPFVAVCRGRQVGWAILTAWGLLLLFALLTWGALPIVVWRYDQAFAAGSGDEHFGFHFVFLVLIPGCSILRWHLPAGMFAAISGFLSSGTAHPEPDRALQQTAGWRRSFLGSLFLPPSLSLEAPGHSNRSMVTIWHLFYFWSVLVPLFSGIFLGWHQGAWGMLVGLVVGGGMACVFFSGWHATFKHCGPGTLSGLAALFSLFGGCAATLMLTDFILHHHPA